MAGCTLTRAKSVPQSSWADATAPEGREAREAEGTEGDEEAVTSADWWNYAVMVAITAIVVKLVFWLPLKAQRIERDAAFTQMRKSWRRTWQRLGRIKKSLIPFSVEVRENTNPHFRIVNLHAENVS